MNQVKIIISPDNKATISSTNSAYSKKKKTSLVSNPLQAPKCSLSSNNRIPFYSKPSRTSRSFSKTLLSPSSSTSCPSMRTPCIIRQGWIQSISRQERERGRGPPSTSRAWLIMLTYCIITWRRLLLIRSTWGTYSHDNHNLRGITMSRIMMMGSISRELLLPGRIRLRLRSKGVLSCNSRKYRSHGQALSKSPLQSSTRTLWVRRPSLPIK